VSFTTWQYLVLLAISLIAVRRLGAGRASRAFLLVASCAFYAFFDVRLLPVLLGMAAMSFYVGRFVVRASGPRERRTALLFGVVLNLSVLGLFKYYGFFAGTLAALLRMPAPSSLGLVLPIGISFVTFEVLSYLVDIYRGEPEASSLLDFTLMVMFFPHLVAGPILKPRDFIPQLESRIDVSWDNLETALPQFLQGVVKKVLLADSLAMFVDPVFARPGTYSSMTVWLAVIAYSLQIYCDFSGYSDMAIASARCFGLDIPANFNMPYLSQSVSEFWRRWHISLSTWFRNYVYIPLGGSRRGLARASVNTMVVMLLSGLWHGAGWNFIVWGGLHGIAMVVERLFRAAFPKSEHTGRSPIWATASWVATLVFLAVAWVFFRAGSLASAMAVIGKMAFLGDVGGVNWIPTSLMLVLPVVVVAHWVALNCALPGRIRVMSFAGGLVITTVVLAVLSFAPQQAAPFIYFQF